MPQQESQEKNKLPAYAKYSSIAIQMAVIITLGIFSGFKIDEYLSLKFPVFTIILATLAVALAVYLAIKDIIRYNS